jgi:hypothetical protein
VRRICDDCAHAARMFHITGEHYVKPDSRHAIINEIAPARPPAAASETPTGPPNPQRARPIVSPDQTAQVRLLADILREEF